MDLSNIILNNKYQLQKKIGSGSYGIVYSARHLFTGKIYAVKIILKNQSPSNNNKQLLNDLELNLFNTAKINNNNLSTNLLNLNLIERNGYNCKILKEISCQLRVHKHPNILSIYKVYDIKPCLFVIMDYYPDGDLFATIVEKQRYKNDPFLIKSVFIQLIDAISYCHSKSIYHCDLKPENILVANNGTKLILADFGLALKDEFIESNICCGSSYYMSPERIQNFCQAFNSLGTHSIHLENLLSNNNNNGLHKNVKFETAKGDVWSLSIILINLISIRNPWLKASLQDTTFKAFVKDPTVLMKILPISDEVYHILLKYLCLNPWERGDLDSFRQDVITCSKLSNSGPLSVNSKLDSLEVITTESQMNYNSEGKRLDLCQVPVDHIKLDKLKSNDSEPEIDYIIDIPLDNNTNSNGQSKPKPCGSCVSCGFGGKGELIDSNPSSSKKQSTAITKKGVFTKVFGTSHRIHKSSRSSSPENANANANNEIDCSPSGIDSNIKVDSLLSDYKSIFPSPLNSVNNQQQDNIINPHSADISVSSSMMTKDGDEIMTSEEPFTSTSNSSSSESQQEVLIHNDKIKHFHGDSENNDNNEMNELNDDLSMISIMSVKNSTEALNNCSNHTNFEY